MQTAPVKDRRYLITILAAKHDPRDKLAPARDVYELPTPSEDTPALTLAFPREDVTHISRTTPCLLRGSSLMLRMSISDRPRTLPFVCAASASKQRGWASRRRRPAIHWRSPCLPPIIRTRKAGQGSVQSIRYRGAHGILDDTLEWSSRVSSRTLLARRNGTRSLRLDPHGRTADDLLSRVLRSFLFASLFIFDAEDIPLSTDMRILPARCFEPCAEAEQTTCAVPIA